MATGECGGVGWGGGCSSYLPPSYFFECWLRATVLLKTDVALPLYGVLEAFS